MAQEHPCIKKHLTIVTVVKIHCYKHIFSPFLHDLELLHSRDR